VEKRCNGVIGTTLALKCRVVVSAKHFCFDLRSFDRRFFFCAGPIALTCSTFPVSPSELHHNHAGHAEDGHLEPTADFDYDEIDRGCFGVDPAEEVGNFTPEELDAACKVFGRLVEWIWQTGKANPDGITIRAIIVCWIFTSELRSLTLTEMARGFGKKKQSLGRWVDDFKRSFPEIRICHMKDR
jgi:hypothetical protein